MQLGVELVDTLPVPERIELAAWSETKGFDSVCASEVSDPDAFALLTAVGLATSHVRIGTSVVQLGPRTVPCIAASAATVAQLVPDRFALGLGVSTKAIIEGWHGLSYDRPLERAREALVVLRAILSGERSDFDGAQVRSHGFRLRWPPRSCPPLQLAALNDKMLELAGQAADGVWLSFVPLDGVPKVLEAIDRGASSAGRPRPEVLIGLIACTTADAEQERSRYRRSMGSYLTTVPYRRSLRRLGYEDEVGDARQAWATRDFDGVVAAVSPRMLDSLTVFGSPRELRERIAGYHASGVDTVVVSPVGERPQETLEGALSR